MNDVEQLAAIAMELARPHSHPDEAEFLVTAATPLTAGTVTQETEHRAIGRVAYALRGDGTNPGPEAILDSTRGDDR